MNFQDWINGRSSDEILAEQRAWIICPEPVEMLLAEHGTQLWFNGQVIPISSVNFGDDVALISDGTPVVIHVAKGHNVFPWHEIYNPDGVEAYRQAIYQNELDAIHDEKPSRYALKELIMHACNRGIDITQAQAALSGTEDVLCDAIASLTAALNPPVELVQLPLNDGQQATEDEITVSMFKAEARGEKFVAPPRPESEFAEPATKSECHARFINDVIMRANSKYRGPDMLKCICFQFDCLHKYGFSRRNYDWKITPEEFANLEEAASMMRELSRKANDAK